MLINIPGRTKLTIRTVVKYAKDHIYEKVKAVQVKYQMDAGVASGKFYLTRMDIVGSAFANCHIMIANLKLAFDPYNIANPTRVVDISAMRQKGEI